MVFSTEYNVILICILLPARMDYLLPLLLGCSRNAKQNVKSEYSIQSIYSIARLLQILSLRTVFIIIHMNHIIYIILNSYHTAVNNSLAFPNSWLEKWVCVLLESECRSQQGEQIETGRWMIQSYNSVWSKVALFRAEIHLLRIIISPVEKFNVNVHEKEESQIMIVRGYLKARGPCMFIPSPVCEVRYPGKQFLNP